MNKLWKAAGILGGVLVVTAGSGTLVLADETSTEVTDDNSGSSVLDTDEWAQKAAANVTDYANIRQEGSQESERVGVLPKGAAAQVVEQEGDWTKITSGSVEGYVRSDLLVFGEEAKNLYEESYGSQGTVTASSLRVRKEPSMDAGQIGNMKGGRLVSGKLWGRFGLHVCGVYSDRRNHSTQCCGV